MSDRSQPMDPLIHGYRLELFEIPCVPGAATWNAKAIEVAEMNEELFPRLWVSGMGVCATFGGPRMGPIFGGMPTSPDYFPVGYKNKGPMW